MKSGKNQHTFKDDKKRELIIGLVVMGRSRNGGQRENLPWRKENGSLTDFCLETG